MTNTSSPKEIKLIAIYGRVSTSNQENEGTIETQLTAVKDFAVKNNYTIVQEYLDNGWSGDMLARPALDQLRQDAKGKLWNAVLIYDPDRLARRYSYQELLMDELREAGIEVLFVTVSSPKNSEDKILHGVRGLFAEYERAKISERFRLGKLRKVKEGHVIISEAPYGYHRVLKNAGKDGYYEINIEEARVVKMLFTWVAEDGLKLRAVVKKLHELNIKPRKSKRGVWSTSTLSSLYRNKTYIGEAPWGSSYGVVPENPTNKEKYRKIKKTSRRMKPEEEWLSIPVPAILERDLFMKARAQLEANFALCERNKKNEYLLANRIQCVCGRKRGGEGPQHGKHLYYRCNDRVCNFPLPQVCEERGINARIADRLVWEKITELMSSPELLLAQVKRWASARQAKSMPPASDVEVLEKEIQKLNVQEERYSKAYGAGVFSINQLTEYIIPIKERVKSLELQVAEARSRIKQAETSVLPTEDELRTFARETAKALPSLNFQLKRAIVLNVIDKVVGTQERLQVYGYIPLTENHVAFCSRYRHRRSPKRRKVNPV
ncbi:MAG: hypothetical protein A2542_03440 [Parcubacteria group bacterium RIFOXYD2_FULL_52_8]|nr:MAG: hypothetical protein A2542_03440 [Parcubacteria group bacterium RIFOXYD2_FULL_52_8]